jgi:hypothetical protein
MTLPLCMVHFFSVYCLGILYDKVKKSGAVSRNTLRAALFIAVILMIAQFHFINKNRMQQICRPDYLSKKIQRKTKLHF